MFTGIVEGQGRIVETKQVGDRLELQIDVGAELAEGVEAGMSVAINGCCLTVTARNGTRLSFDVVPETLRLTSLRVRRAEDRVNVERALRADARLDGHIVQGHVDAVGVVQELEPVGDDVRLRIGCPESVADLLVPKGSVALDGVSLTVIDPGVNSFSVALIPHTLGATTLGQLQVDDPVNIEVDVLGKYLYHYLERFKAGSDPS